MGHCRHEIKRGPSLPFLPPPPPAALWPFSSSSKKESYQPCITPSNGERKAKNCTHPPSVLSSSSLPLLLHESCKKAAMALALLTLKLTTLKGKEGRSPPEQCKPSRTRAGSELTFVPSPSLITASAGTLGNVWGQVLIISTGGTGLGVRLVSHLLGRGQGCR